MLLYIYTLEMFFFFYQMLFFLISVLFSLSFVYLFHLTELSQNLDVDLQALRAPAASPAAWRKAGVFSREIALGV